MTRDEEDLKQLTGWDAIGREDWFLSVLSGLAMMLIVTYFSDLGRGRAAGLCVLVDIIVMRLRWEFSNKLGFWFAILLILVAQTVVIIFVSFGHQSIPAYGLLPAALVIYLFDEGIIYLFGARSGTRPK
jgi:hypothetical protein